MTEQRMLQAVIDTNVVFEGVTTQGNASGLIVEAWLSQLFVACVSNALAYEYTDVLARKLRQDDGAGSSPWWEGCLPRPGSSPYIFRGGPCRLTLVMTISSTVL